MELNTFLRFTDAPQGLPGPYLQEFRQAYRVLDQSVDRRPGIVLAIGGTKKRKFLHLRSEDHVISLCQINASLLVLDSELHLQPDAGIPRMIGGPQPGHYQYHLLQAPCERVRTLAYLLYSNVLSLFSDIVLIFVEDFGTAEKAIDFLCFWTLCARDRADPQPTCVVMVTEEELTDEIVRFDLMARIIARLRVENAIQSTAAYAKKIMNSAIDVRVSSPIAIQKNIHAFVNNAIVEKALHKLHFSATHTKALMQQAFLQFAKFPYHSINLAKLSRTSRPVPERMRENICEFLLATSGKVPESSSLIASAIVMDAFPPGMHHFPPLGLFQSLYEHDMIQCDEQAGLPAMTEKVRREFVNIASLVQGGQLQAKVQHHARVQGMRGLSSVFTKRSCSLCILQSATVKLDCHHVLCDACVMDCSDERQRYYLTPRTCTVCRTMNKRCFSVKPPTAGVRTLELGGMAAYDVLHFLGALTRCCQLQNIPIRDYFDIVLADGVGIFFLLALFEEGWDMADCSYHVPRLGSLKAQLSTVSFGENLRWDISSLSSIGSLQPSSTPRKSCNARMLLPYRRGADPSRRRRDVCVRYTGGRYTPQYMRHVANKLISSFFYIELIKLPVFYTSPETCTINVLSRIPPSDRLCTLLSYLQGINARILYRGSETTATLATFCTKSVVHECQRGKAFSRPLTVRLHSFSASVDVQLVGLGESSYHISNCPYRLDDMVRDQGLDCAFGVRNLRSKHDNNSQSSRRSCEQFLLEVNELVDSLALCL